MRQDGFVSKATGISFLSSELLVFLMPLNESSGNENGAILFLLPEARLVTNENINLVLVPHEERKSPGNEVVRTY